MIRSLHIFTLRILIVKCKLTLNINHFFRFRMWFIITGLFFVTVTGNPAANRGERYSTTLEQNKWIKQLENPCRAPLNAETNQTRLTIEGQESVIRIMAGNMKSRLDMVQHKLVSYILRKFK